MDWGCDCYDTYRREYDEYYRAADRGEFTHPPIHPDEIFRVELTENQLNFIEQTRLRIAHAPPAP